MILRTLSRTSGLIRLEEKFLLFCILGAMCASLMTGTGFSAYGVARTYFEFFALYYMVIFILTRFLHHLGTSWAPSHRVGQWVKGRIAPHESAEHLHRIDYEFARGGLVFLVALTCYTNVKVRLPLINPSGRDDLFSWMDELIFGGDFVWLGHAVQGMPFVDGLLQRVYLHDYLFMAVAALLFYFKGDRIGLRWMFGASAFVYLLGIFVAVLLPSYGPCFTDAGNWQWLRGHIMHRFQATLFQGLLETIRVGQTGGRLGVHAFSGAAAFPSLHVGHMCVVALIAWLRPGLKWYGALLFVATTLTVIATLAYGWHYFVCTPGGIAVAVVSVWLAKTLIERHRRADDGVV